MGFFSSNEKSAAATHPVNLDVTSQSGSGAEQDRYGAHFGASTDKLKEVGNKGLDKLKQAALAKGEGAEQDRYASHFSHPKVGVLDTQKVTKAVESFLSGGKSNHGLGYDGQQRVRLLAAKGTGSEQDRFGAHFGPGRDAVVNAAQSIKQGAKETLERR
ncbi:hypothetical protein P153DRAFT_357439 [Dothidotthia symphoricarpi CBS 119687]|uniref:Uncharacterized protein n=1 Tax=Dothidotthia symphoricarpi CBS 119687 TaxID=1392245 RepID=A0A6A6AAK6_9PLEO|nr:uncharacterized protein P153DRAFT_357439 [Dothidotthia symphoricarpi CBS 119687]KAF2128952.1 hypothetical protein P153DRAFT_357439 [Dothidotthia symphoricarpi CBS 119687]